MIDAMIGTPQNPSGAEAEDVLREVPRVPRPRPEEPVNRPPVRQVILHRSYLERFGFSDGCPKCRSMIRGEESSRGHVESCRKRIEAKMAEDPELRKRLDAARLRADHFLAGEVDKGDDRKKVPVVEPHRPGTSGESQSVETPVNAADVPVPGADEEDDNIPEVAEGDQGEEENPAKRARVEVKLKIMQRRKPRRRDYDPREK